MFLYPLQTCSTKSSMNLIWARSFFEVICANNKEINDWWWWYTLPLFEFLMFCRLSILGLHLYLVMVELFDEVIPYTFFDVVIACTLTSSSTWAKQKKAQKKLLLWNCTHNFTLSTSDQHNTFHVACSFVICTFLWTSIGPYSTIVWDDMIDPCCFDMWDIITLEGSMVTPIPIPSPFHK